MKRDSRIGFSLAVIVASFCSAALAAPTKNVPTNYPWGAEPLTAICDMHEGAPISDKCYGFVVGVVESMVGEEAIAAPDKRRFCPRHATIPEMIASIRHSLRDLACAGLCTSASYVAAELYRDYPCHAHE